MKLIELGKSEESIALQWIPSLIVTFLKMSKQIGLLKRNLLCPNLALLCLCVTLKESFTINCKLIEAPSMVMRLQVKCRISCLTKVVESSVPFLNLSEQLSKKLHGLYNRCIALEGNYIE
ncbi:hypothetical protein TNCV_4830431 [Trichonephila clavipes]|nr:hypothetical protein TNCV_4830431 [Trichonephila clavipes]